MYGTTLEVERGDAGTRLDRQTSQTERYVTPELWHITEVWMRKFK